MVRHLIPISGKDSLATALFMAVHEPRDYEYFYNDNGAELPETYEWLARVEREKGWKIHRIGSDLTQIIKGYDFLPGHKSRYCTRESKIEDETGGEGWTWREGYRLSELLARRDEILKRRVDEVVNILRDRAQGNLFGDAGDTELGMTSCGLLCGK